MQKSFLNLEPRYSKQDYQPVSKLHPLLDIIPVLEKDDFDFIYRPNDDSYLFLDILFMELHELKSIECPLIAEIGCGSGFLINNLMRHLQKLNRNSRGFAIDINFDACFFTKKVANHHDLPVEVIMSTFLEGVKAESLDAVICNPPYVITDPEEDQALKENLE